MFDLISAALAGIGFFTAARLFHGGQNRSARAVLGVLLGLMSLSVLHPLLAPFLFPVSEMVEPPAYLIPPVVGLLIRRLTTEQRWRVREVWHFLPAAASLVWALGNPWGRLGTAGAWIVLIAQTLAYAFPAAGRLQAYRRQLKDQVSNLERIDPRWLGSVLLVYAFLNGIYALSLLALTHNLSPGPLRSYLSLALGVVTLIIAWISQEQRFIAPPGPLPRSRALTEEAQALLSRLPDFMQSRRPHLDSNLSLGDLAEALGTSRNTLSLAINAGLGTTFYDYINDLRIEAFLGLLKDPRRRHQKILALAFDAGFNSKTTFQEAFKRSTGKTPSEFRRHQ